MKKIKIFTVVIEHNSGLRYKKIKKFEKKVGKFLNKNLVKNVTWVQSSTDDGDGVALTAIVQFKE